MAASIPLITAEGNARRVGAPGLVRDGDVERAALTFGAVDLKSCRFRRAIRATA